MKDRIFALRKSLNLSQQAFADRLGIKRTTISNYEIGRNDPVDSVVSLICREFGVSETWLRTGAGEMYADRSREEEMASLVQSLMADRPESFRTALVTTLLRFDPNGPEWEILERIYNEVASSRNPEN